MPRINRAPALSGMSVARVASGRTIRARARIPTMEIMIVTPWNSAGRIAFINFGFGWDHPGTPVNGDTFRVNTGTAVMAGGRFQNSSVTLSQQFDSGSQAYLPTPTFNLIGRPTLGKIEVDTVTPDPNGATINVIGNASVGNIDVAGAFPGGRLTLNMAPGSRLSTTFTEEPRANIHVTGGTLSNDGTSSVTGATIAANVTGSGAWTDGFGRLEFAGSVGRGQTVELSSVGGLTIDDVSRFHGTVMLDKGWGPGIGLPDVLLAGIHGDSYSYRNDMLTISSGGTEVAHLRILEAPGEAFTVNDTPRGTSLVGNFGSGSEQVAAGVIPHLG